MGGLGGADLTAPVPLPKPRKKMREKDPFQETDYDDPMFVDDGESE
jgi:hypothetical protein